MANDLATLRGRLELALRDSTNATWTEAELNDLLGSAAAQLYPRVARPIVSTITPLIPDQEEYSLPSGMREVSRVDVVNSDTGVLYYPLASGTWEIRGDVWGGAATLFINSRYSDPSYELVVHGYGVYDLVTSLPADIYVPFILASARAKAWTAMLSSRARFENWLTLNQKENVSVNELAQMISIAESEAERELRRLKTWRKPKPAR